MTPTHRCGCDTKKPVFQREVGQPGCCGLGLYPWPVSVPPGPPPPPPGPAALAALGHRAWHAGRERKVAMFISQGHFGGCNQQSKPTVCGGWGGVICLFFIIIKKAGSIAVVCPPVLSAEYFFEFVTFPAEGGGASCVICILVCRIQNLEKIFHLHILYFFCIMKKNLKVAFSAFFWIFCLSDFFFWAVAQTNCSTTRQLEIGHYTFLDQFHTSSTCMVKCMWLQLRKPTMSFASLPCAFFLVFYFLAF